MSAVMEIENTSRLSLSEAIKFHKLNNHNTHISVGRFEGMIQATLKEDGKIVQQICQRNLATRWLSEFKNDVGGLSGYVFISNDDSGMSPYKNIFKSTMESPMTASNILTRVRAANTWTYQVSWAAPATYTRTIRMIGITSSNSNSVSSNVNFIATAICASTLSQPILQTTSQTLDVQYVLTFVRA